MITDCVEEPSSVICEYGRKIGRKYYPLITLLVQIIINHSRAVTKVETVKGLETLIIWCLANVRRKCSVLHRENKYVPKETRCQDSSVSGNIIADRPYVQWFESTLSLTFP